jgi:biotin operon repressor
MKSRMKVPKEVQQLKAKGKKLFRATKGVKVPSLRKFSGRRAGIARASQK